jgi:hypothetical protein
MPQKFQTPSLTLDLNAPETFGNLAESLDDSERRLLADDIVELVKIDLGTMDDWLGKANGYLEKINSDVNTSASDSREQDGSNDSEPPSTALTLSAVIQYAARATGSILSEPDLIKASEPGGEQLAAWVSTQLRTVDPNWVTDTDPLCLHMGVTGLGWRKRWFDEYEGQYCSSFLTVNEVIVSAKVLSLARAPRITHAFERYPYEIERSIAMKHWVDYNPRFEDIDPQKPQKFYETDLWLDLDGDGYDEPWTITVALDPMPTVVKIKPRWTKKTITDSADQLVFRPFRRFYAYKLIPDPEGSFFPKGFGWLLERPEAAADSLLASITDTAQSSAQNGGIASTGGIGLPNSIEIKNDRLTTINTDGQPLANVLSLFPQKQVTPGMFQSLDRMMTLGDRLAGTLNLMENSPASMTATLARGIIDTGSQVQSAIHRRLIGSMTEEARAFALMADAGGQLPDGVEGVLPIEVTADPNMATELHRAVTAQAYLGMTQNPVVFNVKEAGLRYCQTMRFPMPEKLIAQLPPPQPSPVERADMMVKAEKEKTARIKANAAAGLAFAQAIKTLMEAQQGAFNLAVARQQMMALEQTMEALNGDANSLGGDGAGVAGQPDNPGAPQPDSGAAGTDNGGNPFGTAGQPNPTGGGGSAPQDAGAMGT